MQQKNDHRRPNVAIYRPPVRRQGKGRDFPRGGHSSASRAVVPDEDVNMSGAPKIERRYNPYAPRKHYVPNKRKPHRNPRGNNPEYIHHGYQPGNGFKISILQGKKLGKEFIYKTIISFCKGPFVPFNFKFVEDDAIFFLNDHTTAREMRDLNRKVTTPDGFQMVVLSHKCQTPTLSFDPETLEMIKNIISARYDAMSCTLNLANFQSDKNMKSLGLCLPLNNSIVFSTITKIIKEHIPKLGTLDLSDNKLNSLTILSNITTVCKQLKSLSLRKNRLRYISDLNVLKGLDVVDLILDENPLCGEYKDKTSYISAVRDRFPKLINLDGMLLPAPIGFDLGTENLPESKKSFFAADDVKDMVIKFLDQYYTIYDSGDRTKLLDAYHDQAYFSLCLSRCTPKTGRGTLGAYSTDNRNLLMELDASQKFKLLKHGKLSIVAALSELPQTMHDPSSFSIDIFHISPNLMSFSVIGVFKEVGAEINNATTKTFSRTYVVAAQGQGFVITNETLFIAHASQDQQSKAFKVPAPTPSPSPAPPTEEKGPNEKELMVIELSKQTTMNTDFSAKCLEENDWDYQRAVAVFMRFQNEGKLPPEAFISHDTDLMNLL